MTEILNIIRQNMIENAKEQTKNLIRVCGTPNGWAHENAAMRNHHYELEKRHINKIEDHFLHLRQKYNDKKRNYEMVKVDGKYPHMVMFQSFENIIFIYTFHVGREETDDYKNFRAILKYIRNDKGGNRDIYLLLSISS